MSCIVTETASEFASTRLKCRDRSRKRAAGLYILMGVGTECTEAPLPGRVAYPEIFVFNWTGSS